MDQTERAKELISRREYTGDEAGEMSGLLDYFLRECERLLSDNDQLRGELERLRASKE